MWFDLETIQRIQQSTHMKATGATPEQIAEAEKKREIQQKIDSEGKGVCQYCGEAIYKNEAMVGAGYVWESETLLGYCPPAGQHKHNPKISLEDV